MGGVKMEWKEVDICQLCDSVSETYKGNASEVVLINTSDVLDGKCLNHEYVPNKKLKGQFKKTFRKGDILYSEIRPANKRFCFVDFEPKDYIASTKLMVLRAHEDVDPQYLYQILRSNDTLTQLQMLAESRSGTFPQITYSEFSNIMVSLPSQKAQKNIVSILSSLDRKIELNNKINADLEEMAQTIFKNWFVDFEPFKDGKFVESELGMIPEGWKVISLNEILDNVSGYSYKGSELQSSNIAMATIKNFERKGGFKTEGYKEIVISKKIKETQFVDMFDVLVAHTDLTQNAEIVGNPAIVLSKGGYEKLIMSMDLTKVISKIDGITNGLLYCILSTSRFKEHALGYVNGTTVLHMSKKAVPEYTCAFPKDINQIRDLCITLDSIYKRMAVTYEESSRLSHLRDTLLPKLMSGDLEVSE